MKVHLEFISDYICPWCYVGKVRMERIAKILEGEIAIDIDIKPYILYPHITPGGVPKSEFDGQARPGMGRSLKHEAIEEGVPINYGNIDRIAYTMEAHRLAWLVDNRRLRYRLSKQFFLDYFEHGRDIGDEEYLIQTAKKVGVEKATIGRFLDPNMGRSDVLSYIDTLRSEGIGSVPSIRFTPQIVLSSLQSPDIWINYIRRVAKLQQAVNELPPHA